MGQIAVPVDYPADMCPEEASKRTMRVRLFVGVLMMPAMNAHPTGRRVLDTAQTENGERVLQPFGADEASVGEQAMEAQADAERAKDIERGGWPNSDSSLSGNSA